ncbi:MAG: hypothetical protein SGJ10_08950 [Bacteroidota bacterium]|nr:hypothetical protein [Bacteroidota bacterium]
MQITVPAKYDDIVFNDYYHLFYYVENKNRWGIYYANDTMQKELFPCIYDTICEVEYPIFKVLIGNACAFYHMYYKKWVTTFVKNCKQASKPKKRITEGGSKLMHSGMYGDGAPPKASSSRDGNQKKRTNYSKDVETKIEQLDEAKVYKNELEEIRRKLRNETILFSSKICDNFYTFNFSSRNTYIVFNYSKKINH